MKPAFALSFSENGISLHHWSDGDWYCIGSVPLDAPDFAQDIQALRDQGFALENDLTCRLIIPHDQVRILTLDVGGLDAQAGDEMIATTLAGATPYPLEDLKYAVHGSGGNLQVAAVAISTLDEAHNFATAQGFVPERYCLSPSDDSFASETLFEIPVDERPETQPVAEEAAEPEPVVAESIPTAPEQDIGTEEAEEDTEKTVAVHRIADVSKATAFRSAQDDPFPIPPAPRGNGTKRVLIPAVAASVIAGMALGAWSLRDTSTETPATEFAQPQQPAPEQIPEPALAEPPVETAEDQPAQEDLTATDVAILEALDRPPEQVPLGPDAEPVEDAAPKEPEGQEEPVADPVEPELAVVDQAILEALEVAPTVVEDISPKPEEETTFYDFTGTIPVAPALPDSPSRDGLGDIYLASVDRSDLSQDAIALPDLQGLRTDTPFEQVGLPAEAGQRFELDERGLVTPSAEGTLNPDGIMVYDGRPASVPPEPPIRFEAEPEAEEPDQRLAGLRPRLRPDALVDQFERGQLGGRSLEELAVIRPKLRPASLKPAPVVDETPTALAVVRVPRPKPRPANTPALVAQKPAQSTAPLGSTANVANGGSEPGSFQPKTVKPKIPTTASVARQATIDNAINLRKLNLIGVYGTPANRRALVRLPSGRYKKLKVGDRIDGGNVVAIGDSELRYQKRGKNVTLQMPRG